MNFVAGRWTFLRAFAVLIVADRTLKGFRNRSRFGSFRCDPVDSAAASLRGVGSPSESRSALVGYRPSLLGFIAVGEFLVKHQSLGLHSPLHRHHFKRQLPSNVSAGLWGEGTTRTSCSVLVVLHHFDGFLRLRIASLLHLAAGHGVRRVSELLAPDPRF